MQANSRSARDAARQNVFLAPQGRYFDGGDDLINKTIETVKRINVRRKCLPRRG